MIVNNEGGIIPMDTIDLRKEINEMFELHQLDKGNDDIVYLLKISIKNNDEILFYHLVPLYPRNQFFGKDYDVLFGVKTLISDIGTLERDKAYTNLSVTITSIIVNTALGMTDTHKLIDNLNVQEAKPYITELVEYLDQ